MAKMTKTQALRLIQDVQTKTNKLYFWKRGKERIDVVSVADLVAIEKITSKWKKRIQ
tara:strand:+ start:390 stop:560 length:171 start_codon:yes stop_codon:yes gene_type:complete